MRIALPPKTPFPALNTWLDALYLALQEAEKENRKLRRDVEIAFGNRLILHDAAGLRYEVTVDATGPAISITAL